jgi:hypothetical protein
MIHNVNTFYFLKSVNQSIFVLVTCGVLSEYVLNSYVI